MSNTYQPTDKDFEPARQARDAQQINRPILSYWQDVWLRLKANRQAIACLYILIGLLVFTLAGPWLWQVDPGEQLLDQTSRPPNFRTVALVVDSTRRWVDVIAPGHPAAPDDNYKATDPLPAPRQLKAAPNPNTHSVRLTWTPVDNAASYNIYRHYIRPGKINELGLPLGATIAGNIVSYEDQLKLENRTYYYSITVSDGQQESTNFISLEVPVTQAITIDRAREYGLLGEDEVLPDTLVLPSHPLGTDYLGRDMLSRLIYGARTSLFIGIVAPFAFVILGALYGALAGFLGGWWDAVLMRFADFVVALPFLLFMILFRIAAGTQPGESSIGSMLLAFILLFWPATARLVRGQVLQIKNESYVQAAQLMGAPVFYLVVRQMLPNTIGAVLVTLTFAIPSAIFIEAFLSFIGMGVAPPTPSWGSMSFEGLKTMHNHPHELIFPAIFISVSVLAFNLLGDGLRDALDTKLRNR